MVILSRKTNSCWGNPPFQETPIYKHRAFDITLETGSQHIFLEIPSLKLTFSHPKMDGWNTTFLLGWPIFRSYVTANFGRVFFFQDSALCLFRFSMDGGLNRRDKYPCGFCFVEYYTHASASGMLRDIVHERLGGQRKIRESTHWFNSAEKTENLSPAKWVIGSFFFFGGGLSPWPLIYTCTCIYIYIYIISFLQCEPSLFLGVVCRCFSAPG